MTRPLGLQSVHQPLPASGGEDPEPRDLARTNAPLTVKTFERLVSLADYTDFARCYAGIGKAQAAWAKLGLAQGIMLSVTDALGNAVPADSTLGQNFRDALARYRDPSVPVAIFDAGVVPFAVEAKLFFDERFDSAAVVAAARAALEARYAFSRMQLGEAVAASAVITLLQGVSGVIGVDLDRLYRPSLEAPQKRARLPARLGHVARDGTAHPAELLVLDVARVSITAVGVTV
jgi:predicted phage baseplate assembly protein